MTTYGVTPTGFVKKPLDVIKSEVEADLLAGISPVLDMQAASILGNFIGSQADRCADLWDLGEAVYNAFNPDMNGDFSQDAVGAITGVTREAAKYSTVVCTMNVQAGKTVPALTSFAYVQGNPSARFALQTDVIGDGSGTQHALFQADTTGPVQALAGTLNTIATPVSGWLGVTNATDATLGAAVESNMAFRARRQAELAATGTSTQDAIRADILDPNNPAFGGTPVSQCSVFINDSDVTDGNGLPPRSIEVLMTTAATANQMAQAVWNAKGAGIQTYGTGSGTAVDANGDNQTVRFSQPTGRAIYLAIDLTPGVGYVGDAAIQGSLVAFGATYVTGQDVILSALYPSIFLVNGLPSGLTRIAAIRAGFSAVPVGTVDLSIGIRELANFDSSRITINHV